MRTPAYHTPASVAELLAVDVHSVLRWLHSKELHAINVSASQGTRPRWRIAQADLDSFLLRRRTEPAPPKARRRRRTEDTVRYF